MVNQISLYRHANYKGDREGERIDLSEGRYSSDILFWPGWPGGDSHMAWNDTVSSIKVPPGMTVDLFSDATWKGDRLTITKDIPNLSDLKFNDRTSSLIVYDSAIQGSRVRLWQDADYSGSYINFKLGRYDSRDL